MEKKELSREEIRKKRLAIFDMPKSSGTDKPEGNEDVSKSDGINQVNQPVVLDQVTVKSEESANESTSAGAGIKRKKKTLNPILSKGIVKSEGSLPNSAANGFKPQEKASDSFATEGIKIYGKVYKAELPDSRSGYLVQKKIPADNSCAFTGVGFIVTGTVDSASYSPVFREIVRNVIMSNGNKFTKQILGGRSPESYCQWILNSSSWGGGVELGILSDHFNIEITIMNCVAGLVTTLNDEKGYGNRGYLLYDGTHYNALCLSIPETDEVVGLFPPGADEVYAKAAQIAHDISVSPTFAFMKHSAKCVFKCDVCGRTNLDRFGINNHAINTLHQDYTVIKGDLDVIETIVL